MNTVQKNIFSFSKCSEKIVFPKKPHWHMIFPVFSGYLVLSFLYYLSCIISISPQKYDLSFFQDGISFFYKYDITLLSKRPRWSSLKITQLSLTFPVSLKKIIYSSFENMISLLIEKLKMIKKFTFKKKVPSSLYFYGDLSRRLHILLFNKKKSGDLIYRTEIWLLL